MTAYLSKSKVGTRPAFTLIELIICIAIISLLSLLVLSSIKLVREGAVKLECANNLRQAGLAHFARAHDNRGKLLASVNFREPFFVPNDNAIELGQYCDNMAIFRCPIYKSLKIPNIDTFGGWGVYTEYNYFPGRDLPVFRPGQDVPKTMASMNGTWVMMSDVMYECPQWNFAHANHGKSLPPIEREGDYGVRKGPASVLTSSSGMNSLMGDGSVVWASPSSGVGLQGYGRYNTYYMSNQFGPILP